MRKFTTGFRAYIIDYTTIVFIKMHKVSFEAPEAFFIYTQVLFQIELVSSVNICNTLMSFFSNKGPVVLQQFAQDSQSVLQTFFMYFLLQHQV